MSKEVIWSSPAENDLISILEYLDFKWSEQVCNSFLNTLDANIKQASLNPALFPFFNKSLRIRKCLITKHNILYYKDNSSHIVILRLYDVRQHPNKLKFKL